MKYRKIGNLIDGGSNQPSKFRTKNWVERNDESRETCNVKGQMKFKTTMLRSSLCDYSDVYKEIDIVMPMYNLIEYSDNYSQTSGSLWQYCKDIPAVNNNNNNAIVKFAENNLTNSFNFKTKITGQIGNNGTENVEIMVPLKYLSNFGRTLEMSLILTWSILF